MTLDRKRSTNRRRGVALLLVLVALVIGATAAAIAAQATATYRAASQLDRGQRIADDLALASDAPIKEWLRVESNKVRLPVDAKTPGRAAFAHAWNLEADNARLVVTAFDQRGMVPWREALRGGPAARTLPSDVRTALASTKVAKDAPRGLDEIAPSRGRATMPSAVVNEFALFGAGKAPSVEPHASKAPEALGALIATHAEQEFVINVSTAPIALLEEIGRAAQRDVAGPVSLARSRDQPVSVPPPIAGDDREGGIKFVAASDLWAFRIDASVGTARSSWWATYRQGDRGWALVQRIPITE